MKREKELKIYDVWQSPNGNLFIKISDDYSIAIGPKGGHHPIVESGDLNHTQYIKSNDLKYCKKVGKLKFKK